jgi:hypothetical protein
MVDKIVQFPAGSVNPDDEALQRLKAEVDRRAAQGGFGLMWPERDAPRLDVTPEKLIELVKARQKEMAAEHKAVRTQDQNEARNKRLQQSKEKSRARLFHRLRALPEEKRRAEVELWGRGYSEDPDVVLVEFTEYLGEDVVSERLSVAEEDVWPEPVDGSALVKQIQDRINRHCVIPTSALTVCPFWIFLSYVPPEIAIHAPILTPYGPSKDAGKSTLLYVLSWMSRIRDHNAGPDVVVSPTVGLYRLMALRPTLFIEEGQKLYASDKVQEIFDASWMLGGTVWRWVGKEHVPFRPFCQKACAMLAPEKIPEAAASRHIFFMVLPKLETEPREDFKNRDDDELREIRRKVARWVRDNAAAIDAANPAMPEGFDNRLCSGA